MRILIAGFGLALGMVLAASISWGSGDGSGGAALCDTCTVQSLKDDCLEAAQICEDLPALTSECLDALAQNLDC